MLRAAVFLLALAGCDLVFSAEFDPDIDAGPTADATDAPDALPACWDAAVTGDEDLDAKINGCDNCPLMANPEQEDVDRDGVGDLCDPGNTIAHQIAFFDPLEMIENNDWNEAGAQTQWDYAGGGFKQDTNGLGPSLLRYDALDFDEPMLFVRVANATPNPTVMSGAIAFGAYLVRPSQATDGDPPGVVCGTRFEAGTMQRAWVRADGVEDDEPIPSGTGMGRLLQLSMTGATAKCRVLTEDGRDVVTTSTNPVSNVDLRIGLWTSYSSAVFNGVFVVTPR